MLDRRLIEDLGARISQAMRDSPVQDIEKNVRVLLDAFIDRFDLVPREDFDVQRRLLERAQARLAALEARIDALESGREPPAAT